MIDRIDRLISVTKGLKSDFIEFRIQGGRTSSSQSEGQEVLLFVLIGYRFQIDFVFLRANQSHFNFYEIFSVLCQNRKETEKI